MRRVARCRWRFSRSKAEALAKAAVLFAVITCAGTRSDAALAARLASVRSTAREDAAQTGAVAAGPAPTSADEATACRHRPVEGPIVDGFRPPTEAWKAGNRGVDYGAVAGAPVRAAAAGWVAFAGQVGGELVVAVDHPDGLRSTYSPLESIAVRRGEVVQRGTLLATARGALHLGVFDPRIGPPRAYVDPIHWLARPCLAVLVPLDGGR